MDEMIFFKFKWMFGMWIYMDIVNSWIEETFFSGHKGVSFQQVYFIKSQKIYQKD